MTTRAASMFCVLFVCANATAGELIIPGTGDGLEMLRHLGSAYSEKNPETSVIVPASTGSGGGKIAVAQDRAILGRIAVPLTTSEEAAGIVAVPVVRVPTAFFTHPSLKITDLTSQQIADIFAGKIRTWSEGGGANVRIRVVRREEADSTLQVLRATIPQWKDLVITDRSKTAVTTQEAFEVVAQFEGAIGFGPYSPATEQEFNVLKVDGKHATSIEYPSFTTIRLIFKRGHLTEEAEGFVRFSRSPEAEQIFSRYGGVAERSPHNP